MRRICKNSIDDVCCISRYLYQRYSNNFFGVVSIAQLVEVMDSAVLGGVAEVASSNPRWVIKYFSAFTGIVDLFYLSISIFIINLYQFLILYIYNIYILLLLLLFNSCNFKSFRVYKELLYI